VEFPDRIPAAVRGGDRGMRPPPARPSGAAPRDDLPRWRDLRHACHRATARAHPRYHDQHRRRQNNNW